MVVICLVSTFLCNTANSDYIFVKGRILKDMNEHELVVLEDRPKSISCLPKTITFKKGDCVEEINE